MRIILFFHLAVDDVHVKDQFRKSVKSIDDLKVNTGAWSYTEDHPTPSWTNLATAKVWTAAEYAGLRSVLKTPRAHFKVVETAENVVSVSYKQCPTLTVFKNDVCKTTSGWGVWDETTSYA